MQIHGVPEDQIFYSRDTSFAQRVLEATNGKGVDVVPSSLAGEQLRATWKCMAPFGRFVEFGKRDFTTNMYLERGPFERTVTFAAVDLGNLIQHRPMTLQKVFVEVMDLVRSGSVKPVGPIHEFAVSDIETAFRFLQSGKLAGKVVITPHAEHQCTVGLSFENNDSQSPAFYWATDARFCHLRRGMGVLEDKETGSNLSTKQGLKKAQTMEEAADITMGVLVGSSRAS